MKIQYLPNPKIDKIAWDAAVAAAANGQIYAYSWYLDCMAENWGALVSENYDYLMPLPWNGKWAGVKQIYQPPYTQQLGVFGKEKPTPEIIDRFLQSIPSEFRYVHLNLNEANADFSAPGFSVRDKRNMLLDLSDDHETIHKRYRKTLRHCIRKAGNELHFVKNRLAPNELVKHYREHLGQKIGYPEAVYESMEKLIQTTLDKKCGDIFSVHFADESLAAALFVPYSHGRVVHLFGPVLPAGKEIYASHFLVHNVIKHFSGQDLIFDFEGTEIPSIYIFFRGFRPKEVSFPVIVKDNFPLWIKAVQAVREKLK